MEYDVWLITAEDVYGKRQPTGLALTEAAAYRVAQEAVDALCLSITIGASKAQIAAAQRIFESVRVQRAKVVLPDG